MWEDNLRFPEQHGAIAVHQFERAFLFADLNIVSLDIGLSRSDRTASEASNRNPNNLEEQVTKLYDQLRVSLHRWLLSRNVPSQEAEEIVQETFLRLYRHLHAGGRDENLRAWLFQVAHNLSATFWKGRCRFIEITPEGWEHLGQSLSDGISSPEDALLRKEKLRRVYERLATLTQLQRDCVHLRLEGCRYQEISRILDVSTSTVASSLRNAIARMLKEYA